VCCVCVFACLSIFPNKQYLRFHLKPDRWRRKRKRSATFDCDSICFPFRRERKILRNVNSCPKRKKDKQSRRLKDFLLPPPPPSTTELTQWRCCHGARRTGNHGDGPASQSEGGGGGDVRVTGRVACIHPPRWFIFPGNLLYGRGGGSLSGLWSAVIGPPVSHIRTHYLGRHRFSWLSEIRVYKSGLPI